MKILSFCMCCLILSPVCLFAHGVMGKISSQKAFMIHAMYDDGEPMGYAEIKIYGTSAKIPFQSGWTDRKGRFFFAPDKKGIWKAFVNDGMGHRLALKINIADNLISTVKDKSDNYWNTRPFSRSGGIITGISAIFGIFGLLAMCYRVFTKKSKSFAE